MTYIASPTAGAKVRLHSLERYLVRHEAHLTSLNAIADQQPEIYAALEVPGLHDEDWFDPEIIDLGGGSDVADRVNKAITEARIGLTFLVAEASRRVAEARRNLTLAEAEKSRIGAAEATAKAPMES